MPELTEEGQTSEDELPPLVQLEENYAQTDEDRPLLTLVQLRRRERELENEIADLKKQLLRVNIKSKVQRLVQQDEQKAARYGRSPQLPV